jgi:hypothetical protein
MIDRFSEDLDLVILRTEGRTATQVRNLIRKVEKELVMGFEEVNLDGITSKQTRYRKTAYDYKRTIASESVAGILCGNGKSRTTLRRFSSTVPQRKYSPKLLQ